MPDPIGQNLSKLFLPPEPQEMIYFSSGLSLETRALTSGLLQGKGHGNFPHMILVSCALKFPCPSRESQFDVKLILTDGAEGLRKANIKG